MKHRLLKLGVFLLLGAITTILISWVLTFVNPFTMGRHETASDHFGPHYRFWWIEISSNPFGQHVRSSWVSGKIAGSFSRTRKVPQELVPTWCQIIRPDFPDGPSFSRDVEAEATGWPMLAMLSLRLQDHSVDTSHGERSVVQGIQIGHSPAQWSNPNARLLPVVPICSGFAIDTLFYAATLWLLFAAPFSFRRWRRARRGLCQKCAYPIGSSAVCTECGAAIPSPMRGRARVGVGLQTQAQCTNDTEVYPPPRFRGLPAPEREGEV